LRSDTNAYLFYDLLPSSDSYSSKRQTWLKKLVRLKKYAVAESIQVFR